MPHVLEPASSARARCRGCGERIAAGVLRFGERLPNPFAEGEMTHWFHPECAAFKRPEPFLELLETENPDLPEREMLVAEARHGLEHRRLPRVSGAERATTGRAQCRACRTAIERGAWRIRLVFYEEGTFQPSGFIHARCVRIYLETTNVLARVRRFSADLGEDELKALMAEIEAPPS